LTLTPQMCVGPGANGRILMDSMTYRRTANAITRESFGLFGDLEVACGSMRVTYLTLFSAHYVNILGQGISKFSRRDCATINRYLRFFWCALPPNGRKRALLPHRHSPTIPKLCVATRAASVVLTIRLKALMETVRNIKFS
jgi:hypothetical protein